MAENPFARLLIRLTRWSRSEHWKIAWELKDGQSDPFQNLRSWMGDSRGDYDELRKLLERLAKGLLPQLPHLEGRIPDEPDRVAEENAKTVANIRNQLLENLSASVKSAQSPVDKAVEVILDLFEKNPELAQEKTKAVLDRCSLTREIGLKALRRLQESGHYSGHAKRRKSRGQ